MSKRIINPIKVIRRLILDCEANLLRTISKAIYFIIYYKNDEELLNYLNNKCTINEVSFYHSPINNLKGLVKNTINISNYIKEFYHKFEGPSSTKCIKRLLDLSIHLSSFSFNKRDEYFIGFRRIIHNNKELSLNYINGKFDPSENKIYLFLQTQSNTIEVNYMRFHNSEIRASELAEIVINSIKKLFDEMTIPNYQFKEENMLEISENEGGNIDQEEKQNLTSRSQLDRKVSISPINKYRVLLNKSFYLFTVCKSLKILQINLEDSQNKGELFQEIQRLLYYFIDDNPDNCLIVLASEIMYNHLFTTTENVIHLIKLFNKCLDVLIKYSYKLSSTKNIFKFLKTMLIYNSKVYHFKKRNLKENQLFRSFH